MSREIRENMKNDATMIELRKIIKRNYDDMLRTYDFDGIAEEVLDLVGGIDE